MVPVRAVQGQSGSAGNVLSACGQRPLKAIGPSPLVIIMSADEHEVMAKRRFHVVDLSPDRIQVDGAEAAHALKVLRLGPGDEVILFDGRGAEATGKITGIEKSAFQVEVLARQSAPTHPHGLLTIATAIPKGERADWMVEKCAELGVRRIIPLECERSQVHPGTAKLDRWRRKALEAAKQSRQSSVMEIDDVCPITDIFARASSASSMFFGDGSATQTMIGRLNATARDSEILICIGPEGGFSENEKQLLISKGSLPILLGSTVLRIETAVIAAAANWACFNSNSASS